MRRNDVTVPVGQRVTAKSIDHLATGVSAVVNLKKHKHCNLQYSDILDNIERLCGKLKLGQSGQRT